ncbi:MAG: extracellular solute-binding protein [Anaerolineae bacterium]|nr:extracellular solute-binding protein [Anaerolineae bacterium]
MPNGLISFWQHYGGASRPELTQALVNEYAEVEPELTISYELTPIGQWDKKLTTALAAGSGPDMFTAADLNFTLFNERQWLAPADPATFGVADTAALVDLFLPASLNGLVVEDKLYGVPMEYNVLHTYYRADQFVEVGLDPAKPPTTWTEMGEYGQALTVRDDSGRMTRAGFQWPYRPPMSNEWPFRQFHPLVYQLGGDILNEDNTECTLNTPEAERAAEVVLDFIVKYRCSELGYTIEDKNPEFWQERSSMDFEGPWGVGLGRATNPELFEGYPDSWWITNFPTYGEETVRNMSPLWRYAYMVTATSPNPQDAWGFIDFVSRQQIRWLTEVGDFPARKGWEDDPIVETLPWLAIQLQDYPNAVPVPQTAKYFEIEEQVGQALERITTQTSGIKESLEEATTRINEILAS